LIVWFVLSLAFEFGVRKEKKRFEIKTQNQKSNERRRRRRQRKDVENDATCAWEREFGARMEPESVRDEQTDQDVGHLFVPKGGFKTQEEGREEDGGREEEGEGALRRPLC